MRLMIYRLTFFFGLIPCLLPAQSAATDMVLNDKVYPAIEARLEQPGGDTARHFILQQVRSHCGTDDNCQCEAYFDIMLKLEKRFNLPLAIFVGEEMVKAANREGNLAHEAQAYRNIARYYNALGNDQMALRCDEKSLHIFEQLNDQGAVVLTKMALLEYSLSYRKLTEALPEMERLLEQGLEVIDAENAERLHIRLLYHAQTAARYDLSEYHVDALEKIPVSNPLRPEDYGNAIAAAMGRANLLVARKKLVEAEPFYLKALQLCEQKPDRWLEIEALRSLSNLEWEKGNAVLAKSYLDKAQTKAEKLELDDLLVKIFLQKAEIAEAEGRFADALAFTKKRLFYEDKVKVRSAGFNMENYYLQQEKDRLATEKKNQELELQIRKTQLRNSLLITALVILLTIGLLVGLQRQRKAKQELTAQNALIQQQSEQLKSLDAAKSRFFANVSHELRTPLALMLGPIQSVLQGSNLSEKQTRLLGIAQQSGKGLQTLVNEILDLQKLEAGKMELMEKPTALVPFFSSYAAQFESLAQRKEVDFSIETALDKNLVALIDQEKCRQVLYNLLSNAFKFTTVGGAVKVKLEIEKSKIHNSKLENSASTALNTPISQYPNIQISVTDTGPGIHPDDLPHLFDRYFQTTRPDKPAEGGTGIGLALCQEYAKLFGGKIGVETVLGKGSVFLVTFPVRVVEGIAQAEETQVPGKADVAVIAPMEEISQPNPTSNDTSKPTILVVEDNPELQDYIRLVLEEKYTVVTAENGQVALDRQLPTANCQLILSDLMMPVMDGYQFLEKLKSNDATRHIPVIMLTARAEARDRLKALRIGVDDYLTKPFDEEELLVRIENLLANSKNRQLAAPIADSPTIEELTADGPFISEPDRVWLESFEAYVQKNLANDALNIPFLAFEFAMSESTLLRQLKRLTGLSPVQYLQEVRLDKARQLLENRTYDSIAKVADKVGYNDARSFSRSFKQRFGKLPSDFLSA